VTTTVALTPDAKQPPGLAYSPFSVDRVSFRASTMALMESESVTTPEYSRSPADDVTLIQTFLGE